METLCVTAGNWPRVPMQVRECYQGVAGGGSMMAGRASLDSSKQHLMPAFLLRGFWDALGKRGVSLSELERLSGVARPGREDFVSLVAERDVHQLYEAAIALTRDEALGIAVGHAMGTASLHLVGHLILASVTLRQAMELVHSASPHMTAGHTPFLQDLPNGRVCFGFQGEGVSTPGARIQAQITATLMHQFALDFLDRAHETVTVQFPFPAPADASPYQRAFPGGVQFEADGTFLILPRLALDRLRNGGDQALSQQLLRLARDQYGADDDDWTSRVRRALRAHEAPRQVEMSVLAFQLSVTPRGLARRLALEGASLSPLIDEVLYERAQAQLRRPRVTDAQVAKALGYVELSSFYRAFRRWSGGLTPSTYRQQAADARMEATDI